MIHLQTSRKGLTMNATKPNTFAGSFETMIAVADAAIAVSRATFSVKRKTVAFNEAVRAGVVFG